MDLVPVKVKSSFEKQTLGIKLACRPFPDLWTTMKKPNTDQFYIYIALAFATEESQYYQLP
uniref:Uncharacterized protein n=1 Tax=Anguilla anguilla TaxID=7936 RepID=A0A0E9WJS8_ANGAN